MRKTPPKQQKILLKTGASNHRCKKYEPAGVRTIQKIRHFESPATTLILSVWNIPPYSKKETWQTILLNPDLLSKQTLFARSNPASTKDESPLLFALERE